MSFVDSLAIDRFEHLEINDIHYTTWNPAWRLYFLSSNTTATLRSIQLQLRVLFICAVILCDSNQLERISLHCNNLEAIQVTRFINALGEHHNLLELDIEGNVISCDGFFGIVKAVAASPTQNSLSKSRRYSPIFDRRRMHSSFYLCFGRINKTDQIPGFRRMRCICKWLDCLILVLRSAICLLRSFLFAGLFLMMRDYCHWRLVANGIGCHGFLLILIVS